MKSQPVFDAQEPSRPATWKACAKWGLITLLGSFFWAASVFAYGAYSAWRDHNRAVAEVREEVERLRTASEPVSKDDLEKMRQSPIAGAEITNAWLAAFNSFDQNQFEEDGILLPFVGHGKLSGLRRDAEDSLVEEAKTFLTKYDSTVRLAVSASQLGGQSRFEVEIDGEDSFLLCKDQLRCVERLLRLNARVQSIKGDTRQAFESLMALIALSASLDDHVSLAEFGLQQSVLSLLLLEGEWLLSDVNFTESQLAAMQAKLESLDAQPQLTRALIGQRAITFDWLYSQPGLRGATCRSFLRLMSELLEASRKPLGDAVASAHGIRDTLDSQTKAGPRWKRRQLATAASAAKNYCKAFDFYGTSAVHPKLIVVVIAAERYRLARGKFPEQLDQLVPDFLPAVPNDPFDGQPLRIYSREDKFAVYSVGMDGKDDGGKDDQGFGKPDFLVRHIIPKTPQP
jgi:hypothetical protein